MLSVFALTPSVFIPWAGGFESGRLFSFRFTPAPFAPFAPPPPALPGEAA